ncbi:mechanosensitive ion channel family protein [Paraglaciecola aquimarina]|uniref:Small-conductance mechanosensitive channel n=1 Tax=Paraglaciecola algarum TaxID=3050085 RepID=A0ABS9D687_9ALTE|nr:mechanosensitive ion channel domain-containing protein [Paraglaciecola sp. G1-23]MCF2948381.1 mechanosensitive ion channel family protein [Paraglaciecola sp. G1-23]
MNLLFALAIIIAFIMITRLTESAIHRFGAARDVSQFRMQYIVKTVNMGLTVFCVILLIPFMGVEYSQVSIFLSSVFAVLGVALFAQWSILSNITASLVIFFGFPYRVGDHIKIMDKDDDITGIIEDIALFHITIKRGDELISYPNNLILQKGVIKNPKPKVEQVKEAEPVKETSSKE